MCKTVGEEKKIELFLTGFRLGQHSPIHGFGAIILVPVIIFMPAGKFVEE
jgi:hypothetical protein